MADSGQPEKTYDVFLSYSRVDKAVAKRVHQRLTQRGLTCFYDDRSLNLGDLWRPKLYRAIKSAKTMVLIITPNSAVSKEVSRETSKALNYNTILCPIVIGKVNPDAELCVLVDEYHWQESTEPPTDDELNLLVEKVAAIVGVEQKLPVVTILVPPGGTKLQPGDTQRLAWEVAAATGTSIQQIGMELLQHGAAVYAFPGKESPWAGSVRECAWTVPASLPAGDYTLRIYAVNNLGHVGMQESPLPLTILAAPGRVAIVPVPATVEHARAAPAAPNPPVAIPESVAFQLLEPAANAKWSRGRVEVLRVQVPETDRECGLKIELVSPNGSATVLRDMPPLELRGLLILAGVTRVAVVSTVVPLSTALRVSKIRITLTEDDRTTNSPLEIPVEIIQPSLESVVRFQQNDSLEQSWGAAVVCTLLFAALFAAALVAKQCWPLVSNIDSSSMNLNGLSTQLGEAAGSVLSAHGLTVLLISVAAGVLAGVGSYFWESNERKWLGGSLLGTAWGGGLGVALTVLNASGPLPHNQDVPLGRRNGVTPLGQVDEGPQMKNFMKQDSLFSQNKLGSQASKMILSSPDSKISPEPSESKPADAPTNEIPLTTKVADKIAEQLFLSPTIPDMPSPTLPAADPAPSISAKSPFDKVIGESGLSIDDFLYPNEPQPDWHKAPLELEWKLLWSGMALGAILGFFAAFSNEPSRM